MAELGSSLARVFAGYDPLRQFSTKAAAPTFEDIWRQRLAGQGAISKPQRTLGEAMGDALAAGGRKAGLKPQTSRFYANRLSGLLNDFTPVGNVTGAEEGAGMFGRGVSKRDLKTAAIGAGMFGLSMLPFAGGKARPLKGILGDLVRNDEGAIRAWHGSPHDFDKFDMSKMGTGEGNQSYGRGLYFAENPAVAGSYVQPRGAEPRDVPPEITGRLRELLHKDDYLGFDTFGQAVHAIRSNPLDFEKVWEVSDAPAIRKAMSEYDSARWSQGQRPRLYEADINAEPEHFYDLDTGPRISEAEAQRRGFKGFRYLDQGSRVGGNGTRNYVVFDDSLLNILNKY